MKERPVIDVSGLPAYAFGHRSMLFWGLLAMMALEGMFFVVLIAAYFYMRQYFDQWPPSVPPPDITYGTINTVVLLASVVPNIIYKRAAEREDLRKVRIWLVVAAVFAVAFIVIRALEFGSLNCSWDTNAYGSVVWTLLGAHTAHLITDFIDTVVLIALMFTSRISGRRFVDVSENALYWYFVVAAWIPIYVVIYFGPYLL
ncbi:MAG TPA: cytochrome c oxidase subunit 3 [Blastocatellia bacterium]|nr:cytochrome c oxidase subunit 3 [Blastocatellia bacterium]